MRLIPSLSRYAVFFCVSVFAVGCRDSKIIAYRVPKEKTSGAEIAPNALSPAAPGAAAVRTDMANTPLATAVGAGLTWQAAAAWQSKPSGAMRKGSYAVTNASGEVADLSITAFPGNVGGEMANVNRWRGQLQLPSLTEAELAAAITRLDSNGLKIAVVDLTNSSASPRTRMLGAIIPYGEATWFFKLLGPDAAVALERAAFLEFLKTIQSAPAPSQQ